MTRVKALGSKTVPQYRQVLKAAGELRKKPLTSASIIQGRKKKELWRRDTDGGAV